MPKVPKKTPKKANALLDSEDVKSGEKTLVARPKKDGSILQDPSIPVREKKASFPADEDFEDNSDGADDSTLADDLKEPKGKVAPADKNKVSKEMKSDIEATRIALSKEETVHFMIPLALGEKAGAHEDVWINGFHTRVPKGVMSILPKSIADLLANKYQVEAEAGSEFRLDLDPDKQDKLS